MRRLRLRKYPGGEFRVWETPQKNAKYIVSCDPSLGRSHTEGGDHSAVGVWKRWPGHIIEQVAELHVKWPVGRVGEAIACLSRAYGGWEDIDGKERDNAIVNIERNLMDTAKWAMVENQQFPEEFLFVPRNERSVGSDVAKVYFTIKDHKSEHYLINTLHDYLDRKAIIIRSTQTIGDIRSLEKRNDGSVPTNGKDLAVMTIMACVADQEMSPPMEEDEKIVDDGEEECPPGKDRELWAKKHKKPKSKMMQNPTWRPAGFTSDPVRVTRQT